MGELRRVEEQLRRSYEGGAWHGPAVTEILAGITPQQAAARPIAGAHTIGEIVLHMAAWKSVVARRIAGEIVSQVPDDVDWPPFTTSDEAWRAAEHRLAAAHDQLLRARRGLSEADLDLPPYDKASTRYVQLHGIIQHDLYHAGQIAVLKKG